jgi:hypothetical protein
MLGLPITSAAGWSTPQPNGDPGSWKLILNSQFEGPLAEPWSTGWFGDGVTGDVNRHANDCLNPAQVASGHGELNIRLVAKPEMCDGKMKDYETGLITTDGRFSFTYGFVQVRVWSTATSSGALADWPSVWTDGRSWPADGELGVLEGLNGHACWHFHDPKGAPGGCATGSYGGGWHTYGADWEPGRVTYYYDGHPVGTISNGITSAPMYLIVGLGAGGDPVIAPATMRVQYVRVWCHPGPSQPAALMARRATEASRTRS